MALHSECTKNRKMFLQPADIYVLTEEESRCPFLVKTSSFPSLAKEVAKEIGEFSSRRSDLFAPTKVGRNENVAFAPEIRGDLRCWLSPKICSEENLTSTSMLVKNLIQTCVRLKPHLNLNGDYSIQVTKYPGNGSRYLRHRDTFSDGGGSKSYRKLTLIYYLNEEFEGGQLRVYMDNLKFQMNKECSYIDVDPKLDTLVMFRSEFIDHEILPSFKDRFAITVWASANSEVPKQLPSETFVPNEKGEDDISLKFPLVSARIECEQGLEFANKSIFVSIANYMDTEGQKTLLDLFVKAAHSERIFVGYVYQGLSGDEEALSIEKSDILSSYRSNIRYLFIPASEATGPCLARHLAQRLWQSEDYFLQIDSHIRFRPGWDDYLIKLHSKIETEEKCKPIITTYPPAYNLPNQIPDPIHPTVLIPWKFDESGLLRQKAITLNCDVHENFVPYYNSPLWAAGFSFSDSSVLLEVPYSNYLPYLFFGEEVLMALRFFSHGYTFFSPGEAVVFHLYSRSHRPTIQLELGELESKLRQQSINVVKSFMNSVPSYDYNDRLLELNRRFFALGSHKDHTDFAEFIGVDFSLQRLDLGKDWLTFIIPPKYSIANPLLANGLYIEDEEVKSLKQDLLSIVSDKHPQKVPSNNAVQSILRFLK